MSDVASVLNLSALSALSRKYHLGLTSSFYVYMRLCFHPDLKSLHGVRW